MNHCTPLIILSLLSLSVPVLAQQGQNTQPPDPDPALDLNQIDTTLRLAPVVVTARKWTEFAQNVPQSLSVIGSETIRDAGLRSLRDAAQFVPNLHMTEFTSRRLSFPTFRGISTGVGDPSVTTYIDGVPQLAISSTNISLLDVDRLEFLRGPQGTLYGRNSIGGLIKVETARPSNTMTFSGSTTWGDFDLQEHRLSLSGPIIEDKLFISLSGLYSERDGYTKNNITGNRVDDRRSRFGRGKLLFTPDDQNEFTFTVYNERSRDGGFALGFLSQIESDAHHIAEDFEGKSDRDITSYALTWNHYGDSLDITSISSYVDWDISEEADFDFSPIDGVRRFTDESQEFFYQEIRISTPQDTPLELGDSSTMKWVLGSSFFDSESSRSADNEFRPAGAGILFPPANVGTTDDDGEFDDYGIAVFGQATITFDEVLDLTAGLRFDYEKKKADLTNTFIAGGFPILLGQRSESESFDEFAPNFSVAFHVSDTAMLYGRAAKGFKAGGFNLNSPSGNESFNTETNWTYEAGLKSTWFDDRLTFNAAFFYIDWDDLQLSLFDATSGGYIDNAGQATSTGIELEMRAKVAKDIEVFAGFGYTNAEFDEFVDPFGQDNDGNNLAFVPETTFNVGVQVNGQLGRGVKWFARGEYVNTGTYYLDAGNREQESYNLANFRLGARWNNVRIEGWIRNAFDEEYVQVAFQPSPFDPTTFVGENGAPQTMGITVSFEF